VAAPDIDKSSSVPLDRTVCIADKELAGREGAGRTATIRPSSGPMVINSRIDRRDPY
jgi:hypothetical protein